MKFLRKNLITILLWLIMLTGFCLLLYPTVSDRWNAYHQTRAIAVYSETVSQMDDGTTEAMLAAAEAFNAAVTERPTQWYLSDEDLTEYESLLDATGTGIMGYVDIPKINCYLPIYHGTDDAVLQIAVGHIEGSSLPVGGAGTHTVLSGHRGLPSAKLFTDLDKLEVGDTFMLNVLGETLTYQVDLIRIVLPDEVDGLEVVPGEDYCTLVTCTPYGVNTHRLLVRGTRIETSVTAVTVSEDAIRIEPLLLAPIAAIPMLLILLVWSLMITPKKKRRLSPDDVGAAMQAAVVAADTGGLPPKTVDTGAPSDSSSAAQPPDEPSVPTDTAPALSAEPDMEMPDGSAAPDTDTAPTAPTDEENI